MSATAKPVVVRASVLRDVVAPVIPHAGTDKMLPVLNAVHLVANGTTIVATATDRFRAAMCRGPVDSGSLTATIPLRDLRVILGLFKPSRWDDPLLELSMVERGLQVSASGAMDGLMSASLTVAVETQDYPSVQRLFGKALREAGAPRTVTGLNPSFLSDFKHAARDGNAMLIRPGVSERDPLLIVCGEHFLGIIMPKKAGETTEGEFDRLAVTWAGHFPADDKADVA